MSEGATQRKLAAILAADVVGYSRLMGDDEEATLAALTACRAVIDPLIERYGGRVFGRAGDSVIAEFGSPVEAVRCATEMQLAIEELGADTQDDRRMRFRIGINLGDVVVDGDDLKGDGVNVAARLEALAPPGGVCLSEPVLAQVQDRLGLDFLDLGEHRVKNIARPIRVYRIPLASEERIASPYRGLDTFEFEHADMFFGRSAAIAAAKERLEKQAADGTAFLLIYGMSGSGKSSLLRAGLLPAMVDLEATAGIGLWRHCLFRPTDGQDPIDALTTGLASETALPALLSERTPSEIVAMLRKTPGAVSTLVRSALGSAAAGAQINANLARLIVGVDQMEELFTAEAIDREMRETFIAILSALAGSGHAWIVATIRADFYHRCGEVPGFSELKDGLGSYELLPPTGPEIAQMIREPARVAGIRFDDDAREGNLADVIQQAAVKDPGSLPLLEFVLDALYEAGKDRRQMTFAAYRALGGLEGAIARRADEITGNLPQDVQAALPTLINALTTVRQQDDSTTARPAPRAEIAATPEGAVLTDALLAARLLVSSEGPDGVPMIRLAHEALLSNWPRARDIVAANREFLATRARVRSDAARWIAEERAPDLLLPDGKRLAEAEDILAEHRPALADDVVAYIEASSAEQDDRYERQRAVDQKRLRRTRFAAAIALVLALAAAAGATVGFQGQQEALRQAEVAERNAEQALAARSEALRSEKKALNARNLALQNESLFLAFQSKREAAAGNTETAIRLALAALPVDPEAPNSRPFVEEAEAELYRAILNRKAAATLKHEEGVAHVEFSPAGDLIATASFDHTARIWDANNGRQLVVLRGHSDELEQVNFSPDGRHVVTASRDGTARVWEVATGREVAVFDGGRHVRRATFSPAGDRIVTDGSLGGTSIWNLKTGERISVSASRLWDGNSVFDPEGEVLASSIGPGTVDIFDADDGGQIAKFSDGGGATVRSVAFDPDGTRLLFTRSDLTALLWDFRLRQQIAHLRGHSSSIRGTAFSPDGSLAATISIEGAARLWNADSGALVAVLGSETGLDSLPYVHADMNGAFSPDGSLFATAALDGVVRVWTVGDSSKPKILGKHDGPVEHVAFSPDSLQLVTASHDGTARIWDLNGTAIVHLRGHARRPVFVAFSPDGKIIATASSDHTARIWEAETGKELSILEGHKGSILQVAFSPDGDLLATASSDGTARVWDSDNGSLRAALTGHTKGIQFVAFGPHGDLIVTASDDGTARLWEARTGAVVATFGGHEKSVRRALFSPDGRFILTASADGSARIWETGSNKLIRTLSGHGLGIRDAAFSADGKRVVTASDDQTARIWRTEDGGAPLAEFVGHNARVTAVSFDGGGTRVVTASSDHTARIWDANTGAQLAVLGHDGPVRHVEFSPGGERVISTSDDGSARLWNSDSGKEYTALPGHSDKVLHAAFRSDGRLVATVSEDRIGRVYPVFPSTRSLITHALKIAPNELSPCQRHRFFLSSNGDGARCSSH